MFIYFITCASIFSWLLVWKRKKYGWSENYTDYVFEMAIDNEKDEQNDPLEFEASDRESDNKNKARNRRSRTRNNTIVDATMLKLIILTNPGVLVYILHLIGTNGYFTGLALFAFTALLVFFIGTPSTCNQIGKIFNTCF